MAIEVPEAESRTNFPSRKALRVLVVADDAMTAILYGELLAEMGHVVCAIETTEAGTVAAADRHKPASMIVDSGLHDDNGVAAVTEILPSGIVPHLFVTGDTRSVQASQPDALVLQKPLRDARPGRCHSTRDRCESHHLKIDRRNK